jgi:hypothetical protein
MSVEQSRRLRRTGTVLALGAFAATAVFAIGLGGSKMLAGDHARSQAEQIDQDFADHGVTVLPQAAQQRVDHLDSIATADWATGENMIKWSLVGGALLAATGGGTLAAAARLRDNEAQQQPELPVVSGPYPQ